MQQAVTGTTPDCAPVSGGIEGGKSHDFTRRALFGVAGAATLAIVPGATMAAPRRTADHSKWKRALAAYRAALAADDRHTADVYYPTDDEINRRAPRPSLIYFEPMAAGRTCEREVWIPDFDRLCEDEDVGNLVRPIRAAWDEHQQKLAAAFRDLRWDEVQAEADRLTQALQDAEDRLFAVRAPTIAAVLFKLDLLWGGDIHRQREDLEQHIMADLAALAGALQ
ncbi:hypothetical protein BH10PSE13_BH10PSE13_00150 [soil metagenome]